MITLRQLIPHYYWVSCCHQPTLTIPRGRFGVVSSTSTCCFCPAAALDAPIVSLRFLEGFNETFFERSSTGCNNVGTGLSLHESCCPRDMFEVSGKPECNTLLDHMSGYIDKTTPRRLDAAGEPDIEIHRRTCIFVVFRRRIPTLKITCHRVRYTLDNKYLIPTSFGRSSDIFYVMFAFCAHIHVALLLQPNRKRKLHTVQTVTDH